MIKKIFYKWLEDGQFYDFNVLDFKWFVLHTWFIFINSKCLIGSNHRDLYFLNVQKIWNL